MEVNDPDLNAPETLGAASEESLGSLHAAVATALTEVIANGATVVDKEGEVIKITAPAPYIGAAIAFLKNNNITASPSKNKDLAALKDTLGKRRQRKEITRKGLEEAADAFNQMQGQNGLPLQ